MDDECSKADQFRRWSPARMKAAGFALGRSRGSVGGAAGGLVGAILGRKGGIVRGSSIRSVICVRIATCSRLILGMKLRLNKLLTHSLN
jgi:hypothetical protein